MLMHTSIRRLVLFGLLLVGIVSALPVAASAVRGMGTARPNRRSVLVRHIRSLSINQSIPHGMSISSNVPA